MSEKQKKILMVVIFVVCFGAGMYTSMHRSKGSTNSKEVSTNVNTSIMSRFAQDIVLEEKGIDKIDTYGVGAEKLGQNHEININNFYIDIGYKITNMGYTKSYTDNKMVIETTDKSVKYEIALVYEGNSKIFNSDNANYAEYNKLYDTYYSKKSSSEGFEQSKEVIDFLGKHQEFLPDIFFTDDTQKYEILKDSLGLNVDLKDVKVSYVHSSNFEFEKYSNYTFVQDGYNNIVYLCRDQEGIYAIKVMYKDNCGIDYPQDEIKIVAVT